MVKRLVLVVSENDDRVLRLEVLEQEEKEVDGKLITFLTDEKRKMSWLLTDEILTQINIRE